MFFCFSEIKKDHSNQDFICLLKVITIILALFSSPRTIHMFHLISNSKKIKFTCWKKVKNQRNIIRPIKERNSWIGWPPIFILKLKRLKMINIKKYYRNIIRISFWFLKNWLKIHSWMLWKMRLKILKFLLVIKALLNVKNS